MATFVAKNSGEVKKKPMIILKEFQGQPGVDSGGLLRQAFTSAFDAISQNNAWVKAFYWSTI